MYEHLTEMHLTWKILSTQLPALYLEIRQPGKLCQKSSLSFLLKKIENLKCCRINVFFHILIQSKCLKC